MSFTDMDLNIAKVEFGREVGHCDHVFGVIRKGDEIKASIVGGSNVMDTIRLIIAGHDTIDQLTKAVIDTVGETDFQRAYEELKSHNKKVVVSDEVQRRKTEKEGE